MEAQGLTRITGIETIAPEVEERDGFIMRIAPALSKRQSFRIGFSCFGHIFLQKQNGSQAVEGHNLAIFVVDLALDLKGFLELR